MWLNARNDTSWVGFHQPTTVDLLVRDLLMTDITRQASSQQGVKDANQASQAVTKLPELPTP